MKKTLFFTLTVDIEADQAVIDHIKKNLHGQNTFYSNDGHRASLNNHICGQVFDLLTPSIHDLESWYDEDFRLDADISPLNVDELTAAINQAAAYLDYWPHQPECSQTPCECGLVDAQDYLKTALALLPEDN